jgi:hypothetical protein
MKMFRPVRTALVALGLVATLCGTPFTVGAAPQTAPPTRAQRGAQRGAQREQMVLQRSITQLETLRGRLQKAPSDFGGHKAKAIDAINLAMDELRQAINFDKK